MTISSHTSQNVKDFADLINFTSAFMPFCHLVLLCYICDFWDLLGELCVIHREPAFVEAGDGWGLAKGP
jgi:hypothetical protein